MPSPGCPPRRPGDNRESRRAHDAAAHFRSATYSPKFVPASGRYVPSHQAGSFVGAARPGTGAPFTIVGAAADWGPLAGAADAVVAGAGTEAPLTSAEEPCPPHPARPRILADGYSSGTSPRDPPLYGVITPVAGGKVSGVPGAAMARAGTAGAARALARTNVVRNGHFAIAHLLVRTVRAPDESPMRSGRRARSRSPSPRAISS